MEDSKAPGREGVMQPRTNEGTVKSIFGVTITGGVLRGPHGEVFRVTLAPAILGRNASCTFLLKDAEVSSTHCELRATPSGVQLVDLDSSNGTFVNGVRMKEALLDAPCTVRVGRTNLTFEPLASEEVDLGADLSFGPLSGVSPSMRQLFRVLRDVAGTQLSVLITGETGTGKELTARALHDASRRADKPFVVIDCGALPPSSAEGALFGYEGGGVDGTERRPGAFHEADGGTVFLDELGELPTDLQPKLLRVLADGQVMRVGATKYEQIDVRVLSATRRDLPRMANAGTFRSDLYFRLAQVRVELSPLRTRREDIPLIVQAYCERSGHSDRASQVIDFITHATATHDWPGNVRELLNVATVVASLPPGSDVSLAALPTEGRGDQPSLTTAYGEAKRRALEEFERRFFTDLQGACDGNISEMTRRSGLARHHVRNYLRRYSLV
ncbi:MAG: sigma 54-interacting transcriptional regulator [Polyangiaceae bacterium]|nr:sigma 54-interacting transcriptional regulator [Polyangiaceae bacterium]